MCRRLTIILWILCILNDAVSFYGATATETTNIPDCTDDWNSLPMLLFNRSYYIRHENACTDDEEGIWPTSGQLNAMEGFCKPKCNLILHERGCSKTTDEGQLLWDGNLCPTEPSVGCSLVNRFTCTSYEIVPLMYALRLCMEEDSFIRNCSSKFDCHQEQLSQISYAVRSTEEITSCEAVPTTYYQSTKQNIENLPFIRYFSLPISELNLTFLQQTVANDSAAVDSTFYIRTSAVHQQVFEILDTSLFDTHHILLKDFAPCLNGLLNHHRAVLLFLPHDEYLFEFGNTNSSFDSFAVCNLGGEDHRLFIRFILLNITTSLSLFGLLITMASMFISKEHLNIPGVNLLNLCGCLMVTYITVMLANLGRNAGDRCLPEGIIHVFGVLASVTWMNIMAFDIWHNLSRVYPMEANFSWRNRSKWLRYWAYGWLSPLTLCGIGCLVDKLSTVPKWLKPHYVIHCWFFEFNTWGTVIFYHGPIGIMIAANLILFLLTAKLLYFSQRHRKRYNICGAKATLRNLFELYLKLFLVLGFTWVFEITNMVASNAELIIANDFINSLQGFFLFLIFACKRKVFRDLCGCFFTRSRSLKKLEVRGPHSNSTTSRLSMSVLPSSPTSPNSYTLKKYSTQSSFLEDRRI